MALFDNLFTESVNENNGPVDYLKDLPLAKFDENMSFMDCGSKGLVLAEAGWLDLCEHINNMDEAVEENLDELSADDIKVAAEKAGDKIARGARAAGNKIKAGANKVVEFMKKVPEILKRLAQNIFGLINKFLQTMKGLVTGNNNLTDAAKAKEGLKKYNAINKNGLKVKGFMFEKESYASDFNSAIARAEAKVNELGKAAISFNSAAAVDAQAKEDVVKEVRAALVGSTPANGPVTSQSFKTDMIATYGSKSKEGVAVTDAIIDKAAKAVKAGYKDEQNAARNVYKKTKEVINKWIGQCKKIASEWEKHAETGAKDSPINDKLNEAAKGARLAGQAMTSVAGVINSYTGVFCSLLHQQYNSYLSIMRTCVGYAQGKKKEDKANESTVENDASLFGLDLI